MATNQGYTTVGSLFSWKDDDVRGAEFTAPSNGTITSIVVYINTGWNNDRIKCILYDYSGNVIAETEEKQENGTTGWVTFNFVTAPSVVSGTKYLVGVFSDGAVNFAYDNVTGLRSPVTNETGTYPTVLDPAGTIDNSYQFSIYAVHEETVGSTAPIVTTQAATFITDSAATGNGNVTSDGGETVTERGVCWSTSPTPTTADSKATASGTTGAFTVDITGLEPNTTYYARAYAINTEGTGYGSEVSFTTDTTPPSTWLARIGAWVYPGSPALNADEEYSDGRYLHFINAEYLKIDGSGNINQLNDPADGENAYSAANAAEVKRHSAEQYVTLAGDGGAGDTTVLARTGTARDDDFTTISDLVTLCGFTGVDVDIEGFGAWDTTKRDNFYSWLTALCTHMHDLGLKVNVDLPPLWTKPNDGSAWDFDILASINVRYDAIEATGVDYMTIMAYDHQYDVGVDGGVTNAVAPEGWLTAIDTYARAQVTDTDKLVFGLNSYGYTANESSPYAITIQTKAQTDAAIDLNLGTRDGGSYEMFYENGSNQHYVWCDETTLNRKRKFIEGLGYKRICVWHLGGNDWFTERADIGRVSPLPGIRKTM